MNSAFDKKTLAQPLQNTKHRLMLGEWMLNQPWLGILPFYNVPL
ncbi:hypothetical protein PEDI_51230 [Persicobacter diffluens]|uniref:Uncharacterized protein n=1 Tax=Persicobacter diffluens TaxID=981 RepID=A0AAN5APR1_9BACT|nr:hypothetical protein PEDI_51230 [Persicobacter diffluens]